MEINANPQRLDLGDQHVRRASELGVKLAINCDAHHADHLKFAHYGVAIARRGWANPKNVVNTWPVEDLLAFLENKS